MESVISKQDVLEIKEAQPVDGVYLDVMEQEWIRPLVREFSHTRIHIHSFSQSEVFTCLPNALLPGDGQKMFQWFLKTPSVRERRESFLQDLQQLKENTLDSLFCVAPMTYPGHFYAVAVEIFPQNDNTFSLFVRIMDSIAVGWNPSWSPMVGEFLLFLQYLLHHHQPALEFVTVLQRVQVTRQQGSDCSLHTMLNLEWFLQHVPQIQEERVDSFTEETLVYTRYLDDKSEETVRLGVLQSTTVSRSVPWFEIHHVVQKRKEFTEILLQDAHYREIPIASSLTEDVRKRKWEEDDEPLPEKKQKI